MRYEEETHYTIFPCPLLCSWRARTKRKTGHKNTVDRGEVPAPSIQTSIITLTPAATITCPFPAAPSTLLAAPTT